MTSATRSNFAPFRFNKEAKALIESSIPSVVRRYLRLGVDEFPKASHSPTAMDHSPRIHVSWLIKYMSTLSPTMWKPWRKQSNRPDQEKVITHRACTGPSALHLQYSLL